MVRLQKRRTKKSGAALLEEVLSRGVAEAESQHSLDAFLHEQDWLRAVECWLRPKGISIRDLPRDRIDRLLSRDIARLDVMLTQQVNAILRHHDSNSLRHPGGDCTS